MENREFMIDCDGIGVHAKLDFPAAEQEKYPLLVIIPGLTGHIEERHIIAVAEAAREVGFAALRSELYGHGKSEGEFRKHNVLIWMSQAMRVIDYASKLPFVKDLYLAGHSQGGLTTVLAGGMMQDRLKALLPLSPAMIIKYGALDGSMLGVNFDGDHLPEEFQLGGGQTLSSDYLRAARILPVEETIRQFTKPVLIVHGTEDEAVPYFYGKDLAKAYANATLVTIEGDDHCYNYHLDQVVEAVKAFLTDMRDLK